MIKMLHQNIFHGADFLCLFPKIRFVHKQFTNLKSDLGKLIGIKGCDPGLGGSEGFARQALLFISVEQDMVAHHDLTTVRNQNLRLRNTPGNDLIDLSAQLGDV